MYNSSPFSLNGKTILITGASSGIGRACAVEISRSGAESCVVTARDESRLEQTISEMEKECGIMSFCGDLTSEIFIDSIVDETDILDGVVISAGINRMKSLQFVKDEDLKDIFNINCFSTFHFVKKLVKKKKIKKGGSIVIIGSISGNGNVSVGNSVYGASKAALTAYTRYAALELAPKGIRCNIIHPGRINTPLIQTGIMTDKDIQRDIESYPLKRYGKPEEVAYAAIYLLSDAATWVTGSELVIDGGKTLI